MCRPSMIHDYPGEYFDILSNLFILHKNNLIKKTNNTHTHMHEMAIIFKIFFHRKLSYCEIAIILSCKRFFNTTADTFFIRMKVI